MLPARLSAARLPHFAAELAKESVRQRPNELMEWAVNCGFGVVRKQRPFCRLCRAVVTAGRREGKLWGGLGTVISFHQSLIPRCLSP